MKRALTLVAALLMVAAIAASVSAETVTAGLIEMERADFERLQGLVSGSLSFSSKTPVDAEKSEVDAGLVKMSAGDLAALQDYVTGRTEFKAAAGKASGESMVNIGLIEIPESELAALKQMVRRHHENRFARSAFALDN